jgi:hypothetical protein
VEVGARVGGDRARARFGGQFRHHPIERASPATATPSDSAAAKPKNQCFFQGMRFMKTSYPTPSYTQFFCPLLRSVYFKNSIC